jgi:diacylglycerol kinase (ATP)
MSALVLLNPRARGGQGSALWAKVAGAAPGPCEVVTVEENADWRGPVAAAIQGGVRLFIAAGGDGTVNALLNALIDCRGSVPLERLVLGAVGLGSSNDFHKPFGSRAAGIPIRLDDKAARPRDVGRVTFADATGATHIRHFVVSASLGLTANGNDFFNTSNRLLRLLKRCWTDGAVAYAVLRTLAVHHNLGVRLDGTPTALTNLSIQKTAYVSGSLFYDTPVAPDDGLFSINLAAGLSRAAALRVVLALLRGRFAGRRGCRHWQAPRLEVTASAPFAVELDGEIEHATQATFEVLPERIGVCA